MRLPNGWLLAYCTNVHRGETWPETFAALETHALRVRDAVCADAEFAIGLRLSARAARELADPAALDAFRRWLEARRCFVFTINGFPYGAFHGQRVKEQVYRPDWSAEERLDYTVLLYRLLDALAPAGVEVSVSTLPGSFKEFVQSAEHARAIRTNLWRCVDAMDALAARTGRAMHLGLEPEPLGLIENTAETIAFFEAMRAERPGDERLGKYLGVNYDTCHFAVEYEPARASIEALASAGIRISKVHLSSALRLRPDAAALERLRAFDDAIYLHQVIVRDGGLTRHRDLGDALAAQPGGGEWRVHFHVPLHWPGDELLGNTTDHLVEAVAALREHPERCGHFEIETYTWEVLPAALRSAEVSGQIAREYAWALPRLRGA